MPPRAAPQTYTLDVHGPQETATLVFHKALSREGLLARVQAAFLGTLWSRFTLTWETEDDVLQAFEVGALCNMLWPPRAAALSAPGLHGVAPHAATPWPRCAKCA